MTDTMASLDLNNVMSDDLNEKQTSAGSRTVQMFALLAIFLFAACYFVTDYFIEQRQSELLEEIKIRQEITVSGKAEIVRTWIDETGQRASSLANHPLFKLFADEINQSQAEIPKALANQLPYMQNAITNFAQQNKLIAAYLIGQNGRAYLASNGSPALKEAQRKSAVDHYKSRKISTSPMRASGENLIFDFLVPVFSAQSEGQEKIAGVLLMTVSSSAQLANILKPSSLSAEGEETRLYQVSDGKYKEITPTKIPYISADATDILNAQFSEFIPRKFSGENEPVYSTGKKISDTNLILLQGLSAKSALSSLKEFSYAVYGLAASLFIVVFSIFSGVWLTLHNQNTKAMADQYKNLAHQINAQRRLLGSINHTIAELIGLTDAAGRYVYANPALARFANFPLQSIPGKTDRDIFGDKAARILRDMDQQVIETEKPVNGILDLETHDGIKHVRIEKSRLLDDDGLFMGVVTVASDMTDYILQQRKNEELGRKTIAILVRMMEDNDPYLAGHSQRMGDLSSHVAKIMDLPATTQQTIATGANLSQIGKISIPSKIRTKSSRLTKQETAIMQGHVDRAAALLNEMEIDEVIVAAIAQMFERMDGSGYPNNLKQTEISMAARILGMADILIARVSPRSYRQSISVEEAMEVFRSNPGKYDVDVVVAMDEFLNSNKGRNFKDSLGRNRPY
ncbi:MAG: PAS domain-containing protein [Sneathiella sp.]|nr:PAS domain-containing protein [Sneathiella sp.]